MKSPYSDLPPRAFWRTGVSEQNPLTISDLYRRKFKRAPRKTYCANGSWRRFLAHPSPIYLIYLNISRGFAAGLLAHRPLVTVFRGAQDWF